MDYRAIATISHYTGEDAQGVAVYEHHDDYCYSDPLQKQATYSFDGVTYTGTTFYAFPHDLTVSLGDTITVDGEARIVVNVKRVVHPSSRQLVHLELIGGV